MRSNAAAAGIIQAGTPEDTDNFVVSDAPAEGSLATTVVLGPEARDEDDGEQGALMRKIMEKKVGLWCALARGCWLTTIQAKQPESDGAQGISDDSAIERQQAEKEVGCILAAAATHCPLGPAIGGHSSALGADTVSLRQPPG